MSQMEILAHELQNLGFKLNLKKCVWKPLQVMEFLVFLIDSTVMKLFLLEEKDIEEPQGMQTSFKQITCMSLSSCSPDWPMSSTLPAVETALLHY